VVTKKALYELQENPCCDQDFLSARLTTWMHRVYHPRSSLCEHGIELSFHQVFHACCARRGSHDNQDIRGGKLCIIPESSISVVAGCGTFANNDVRRMRDLLLTHRKLFIAMAGLPGTGKSAIAQQLGKRLNALVLNKDTIRARLFTHNAIDFSREQDDLCMKIIFIVSEYLLRANSEQIIIVDGRTFSKSYQVAQLLAQAELLKVTPVILECVCADSIARQRLEDGQATCAHPARNRTYKLYLDLKEHAELITVDRLVIDTGEESLEVSVDRCMAYINDFSH